MARQVFFLDGDNPDYGQGELNKALTLLLQQGIFNTQGSTWEDWFANGDLKVTQRVAGANMSVDVAIGDALVSHTRDSETFNVFVKNNAVENVAIADNTSGSNRVDAIILRVSRTATPDALTSNVATIERVAGTGITALTDGAISTAISNDDFIRLADVTVVDSETQIQNSDIADTRVRVLTTDEITFSPTLLRFRGISANPTTSNLQAGDFWYNTTQNTINVWNGTSIVQLGLASALGKFNPFDITEQATPDMTVQVAAGVAKFATNTDQTITKTTVQNSPTATAPTTNPRIDLLTVDSSGTLAFVTGTEAASPTAPTYPDNKIVLCEIYHRVGSTEILEADDSTNSYILRDSRPLTHYQGEATRTEYTAGEALTALDAVYFKRADGKVYKTDANGTSPEEYNDYVGVALETVNTDDTVNVAKQSSIVSGFNFGNATTTVAETLFVNHTSGGSNFRYDSAGDRYAEIFRTTNISNINKLLISIKKLGAPNGVLNVKITEFVNDFGSSTYAQSSVLFSKDYTESDLTTGYVEYDILDGESPIVVKPYTSYLIEITSTVSNGSASIYYEVEYSNATNPDGFVCFENFGGASYNESRVLKMKAYYTEQRNYYIGDDIFLSETAGELTITAPDICKKAGTIINSTTIQVEDIPKSKLVQAYAVNCNAIKTDVNITFAIPRNATKMRVYLYYSSTSNTYFFADYNLRSGEVNELERMQPYLNSATSFIDPSVSGNDVTIVFEDLSKYAVWFYR